MKRSHRRMALREQVNPMASVANLVDIMLVFACGLMIAIITFWNIDLDHLDRLRDAYENIGSVYQDPDSGKVYVVQTSGEADAGGEAE